MESLADKKDKLPIIQFSRTADYTMNQIFDKAKTLGGLDQLDRVELTFVLKAFMGKILDSINDEDLYKDVAYKLIDILSDHNLSLNRSIYGNNEKELILALKEIKPYYIKYSK